MRFAVLIALALRLGATAAEPSFYALCYHEVRGDGVSESLGTQAASTDQLVAHFSWLREHGFRAVRIDDLIAAREGRRPLPPKAVLLTFDDGYASVYTQVYPLLKMFGFPVVVGLVGSWLEGGAGSLVRYGEEWVARSHFLSWDQIREMQASGLVEFASHSYDLHKGVLGNPQGNMLPAAVTHRYGAESGRYETEDAYRDRIRSDLRRNSLLLETHIGKRPRVVVWPYGRYNQVIADIAREEGMPIGLTLDDQLPRALGQLSAVGRFLVDDSTTVARLIGNLFQPARDNPPLRVAQVDLDYVYDRDPEVQERNLGLLLDRIKAMQISTVFLQAFADPDGDGTASALYFPNRHLPVRADLFNRAAWQLHTRAGVSVYAWMPVLAFDFEDPALQRRMGVVNAGPTGTGEYRRLSPFSGEAKRRIGELYEDLARHAIFEGLLFHDDAYLSDFEDAHPEALAFYRSRGLPDAVSAIRADPQAMERWTRLKTESLIEFTQGLAERVRPYHPGLKTARNLYARVVQQPESAAWFAQRLDDFTRAYDYVALMAMPYMEGAGAPRHWLEQLVGRVGEVPGALGKTIFELQARDWRTGRDLSTQELVAQVEMLLHLGAEHVGYYPEDFIRKHPDLPSFRRGISLNDYPLPP